MKLAKKEKEIEMQLLAVNLWGVWYNEANVKEGFVDFLMKRDGKIESYK